MMALAQFREAVQFYFRIKHSDKATICLIHGRDCPDQQEFEDEKIS
jgi:hypothetical protein